MPENRIDIFLQNRYDGATNRINFAISPGYTNNGLRLDIDFQGDRLLINGMTVGRFPDLSQYRYQVPETQIRRNLLTEIEKKCIIDIKTENLSDVEKIIEREVQARLKKVIREVVNNGY